METMKAKLVGIAPIMFHNERLANPTDKLTKELKKLTMLKKKTDEHLEEIKHLEWRAGFYDDDGKIVVPSDNVLACVVNGARKLKRGKDVASGVIAEEAFFPLGYNGPKDFAALYESGKYCDYRSVVVKQNRCMRARPIFKEWWLDIKLEFDPEIIERSELKQSLEIAGERIGLCERRPRCGRFLVEWS